MTLRCEVCGREFEALVRFYRECTPCFLARIEKNPGGVKKVTITCRVCRRMIGDVSEEDASNPNGYECAECYLNPTTIPDDDLPDTDILEGDDPDDYLGIPD